MKHLTTISILIFLSTAVSLAQKRPKDRYLDRQDFVVTILDISDRKRVDEPVEDDQLHFRSNRMYSDHFQKTGFLRGAYAVKKEAFSGEEVLQFEAINKNSKGWSLKWEGTVFADQIEGTAIISKNGKVKQSFSFSGELDE